MKCSKGYLSKRSKIVLFLLFFIPICIIIGKIDSLPTANVLSQAITMDNIPENMQSRVLYILFVPLGALLVVFCRLTLGIRILGPFRSILIAVALQITGIFPGLIFLFIVIIAIVLIRPLLKSIRLPYFARVSILLSIVSLIITITILTGVWIKSESFYRMGYFPIIVLCLTGEGFSRTLSKEGLKSACWRGIMTVFIAVVIALLTRISVLQQFLIGYPEILVIQLGLIIVISEFFDWRLLKHLNPIPITKKSKKKKKKTGTDSNKKRNDICIDS